MGFNSAFKGLNNFKCKGPEWWYESRPKPIAQIKTNNIRVVLTVYINIIGHSFLTSLSTHNLFFLFPSLKDMLKFYVLWDKTSYSPVECAEVSDGRVATTARLSWLSYSENCDSAFLQNVSKHVPNPQRSVNLLPKGYRIPYTAPLFTWILMLWDWMFLWEWRQSLLCSGTGTVWSSRGVPGDREVLVSSASSAAAAAAAAAADDENIEWCWHQISPKRLYIFIHNTRYTSKKTVNLYTLLLFFFINNFLSFAWHNFPTW